MEQNVEKHHNFSFGLIQKKKKSPQNTPVRTARRFGGRPGSCRRVGNA